MANPKKWWTVGVLLLAFVVTSARALRQPNDFAKAHWLVDYRFGFVRRGLVGTLFAGVSAALQTAPTEFSITVLSGAVFAAFGVTIVTLAVRIVSRSQWTPHSVLAVTLFLSSPFCVMAACVNGYYDNIIIGLTVLSIVLVLRGRPWAGAIVQAAAILVHENALLIGMPPFALSLVLSARPPQGVTQRPLRLEPLLIPVAAFAAVWLSQSILPPRTFESQLAARLHAFDFIRGEYSDDVPLWLSTSFAQSFSPRAGAARVLHTQSLYTLVLSPFLVLTWFTVSAYMPRALSIQSVAVVAVSLAPQSLHLVAWDTERIGTFSILSAFLVFWMLTEFAPSPRIPPRPLIIAAFFALTVNIIGTIPLMNGETDHLTLPLRLLLYAPVIATVVALFACERPRFASGPLATAGAAI